MSTAEAGMLYMTHNNELHLVACQNDRRPLPAAYARTIQTQAASRPDSLQGFVALTNRIINIRDAGADGGKLPFRIDRDYDLAAHYRTVSLLAIPIISAARCAGVLVLINHLAPDGSETAFGPKIAQSVAQYLDLATSELQAAYVEYLGFLADGAAMEAIVAHAEPEAPSLAAGPQDAPPPATPAAAPQPPRAALPHAYGQTLALLTPKDQPLRYARRTLAIATLGYLAFVLYASLTPFAFQYVPFAQAVDKLCNAPLLEMGVESRAGDVANLLLFLPLTFLACGLLNGGRGRGGLVAVAAVCLGAMLAVGIEFTQVYFPPRTVSRNDILFESIGGLAGVVSWAVFGQAFVRWLGRSWQQRAAGKRAVGALVGYTVGYVLCQVQPMDIISQFADLSHKFAAGHIVLMPFGDAGEMTMYVIAAKIAGLIPIGYLMAILGPRSGRMFRALAGGAVAATIIEGMRVFVYSCHAGTTAVVLGAVGAMLGGWLAGRLGPHAAKPFVQDPWWKQWGATAIVIAIMVWLAGLVMWAWWPFNFAWPLDLSGRLGRMFSVPFSHPLESNAVALVGMSSILLAMLVGSLGSGRSKYGPAIFTGLVFVVLAIGQIFLETRVPDSTTILLGFLGGLIGARACGPFLRTFVRAA